MKATPMTPTMQRALDLAKESFQHAHELELQLEEYAKNKIRYERKHPEFDVDETTRLYQEFLDAFDHYWELFKTGGLRDED